MRIEESKSIEGKISQYVSTYTKLHEAEKRCAVKRVRQNPYTNFL